jgi:hypothetical protein
LGWGSEQGQGCFTQTQENLLKTVSSQSHHISLHK